MGAVRGNSAVSSLKHTQVGTQAHVGVSAGEGGPQSKGQGPSQGKKPSDAQELHPLPLMPPAGSVHTCLFHLTLKATL